MAPTISLHREQYSVPIPAHRFRQGGRVVYYFSLDLATLDGLLPQRVDDAVIREANRRLTPSHAKNIQKYLEERDDWLLGAMLLGIAHDALDFEPYENENGNLYSENFGQLRFRTRRLNTMRIFDGQHRRRAIQDTFTVLENDHQRADKLAVLEKSSVPIVLYVEEDITALRQMFADASRTKRIEGNVVTQFDRRDAFNMAAKHVAEKSRLFAGRIELDRTTVARTSQRLLSINQLADVLRTSELGYDGRNTRSRNDAYILDIEDLYDRCLKWSDEFLPAARKEYAALTSEEVDEHHVPQQRAVSFAYSATFIRIVAGCYQVWCANTDDWTRLAAFLHHASLAPGAGPGNLLVDAGVAVPGGFSLLSRRQEVAGAIKYILQATNGPSAEQTNHTTYEKVVTDPPNAPHGASVGATGAATKRSKRTVTEVTLLEHIDKSMAIKLVNSYLQRDVLTDTNTHFSRINSRKDVWWFNIHPKKFEQDLHLLCVGKESVIWLTMEANSVPSLEKSFRLRQDREAVDLEISCAPERYMCDVKNGGSGYDFRPYIRREWSYPARQGNREANSAVTGEGGEPLTPKPTRVSPTGQPRKRIGTHRQLQIVWKGQEFVFPTHIEALVGCLKRLAKDDGTLNKLRSVRGRVRPLIATTRDELYPGRPDLAKMYSREFIPGWFVGTNYSHSDVKRLLREAVEGVGILWGVEFQIK